MKVYIANRGEIARRLIRSIKSFGAKACVGYCAFDKEMPFVSEADQAFLIQGKSSIDSYLNSDLVIEAAKKLGATHLHPGYGFLSEKASFVEKCKSESIEFIGPSAHSMRLLGDKIESRKFLAKEGISLLPSYEGDDQSEEGLKHEAIHLGFPILIKPSAGGGGKGMFIVEKEEDFIDLLRSSKRIAQSSFGDDRVFLERYVSEARHIEIQILADKHGNIQAIGERECSLQRRHQKLIEEAPCQFLPQKIREELFKQSIQIAKAVQYESLGTVEWIWDGKDNFYFLEVNTRLQVEHPVTELVYGVDLVEWQLRVACGESIENLNLTPKGHAIEARICAEDPSNQFIPSGGKIDRLVFPEGVRIDFGFEEGNQISSEFDSMLGKVIAYGENRQSTIEQLTKALRRFILLGPKTNRSYLIQILESVSMQAGDLSTKLLEKLVFQFSWNEALQNLEEIQEYHISADEEDLDLYSPWGAKKNTTEFQNFFWEDIGKRRYFFLPSADWYEKIEERRSSSEGQQTENLSGQISSPMPSKVISVYIQEGQEVKKGELLIVLEAMKMEHKVKAPFSGVVEKLRVSEGDQLLPDAPMLELQQK